MRTNLAVTIFLLMLLWIPYTVSAEEALRGPERFSAPAVPLEETILPADSDAPPPREVDAKTREGLEHDNALDAPQHPDLRKNTMEAKDLKTSEVGDDK